MEIKDFYSYKKFGKEFNESFYIDRENSYHTVPLYLIWGEKCSFLRRAILSNYLESPIVHKIQYILIQSASIGLMQVFLRSLIQ
jgi:hypothetical protein